jgi:hypothetical protein
LVDPDKPLLLTLPKEKEQFVQQLSHSLVLYYDNIENVHIGLMQKFVQQLQVEDIESVGYTPTMMILYMNTCDVLDLTELISHLQSQIHCLDQF